MADDTAHGNPWGSPVVVSAPRPATPSPPRAARKEVITPPAPTPAPLAGRLPTVSPPSLAADLREGVRALLASGGRHADLLLASRDGERLPAHRCILEARLGQPLVARLVDATADGACALDAPARAVGALLRYVYTEDVAAAEAEDAPGTAADGAEVERGDARAWAERAQPHFEIIALCAALDAAVGVDSDADDDGGGGDNGTRGAAADGSGAGGVRALRRLRELSEAAIAPLVDPSTAALAASAAWRNGGPQLLEHSLSLLLFKLETAADALGPAAAAADVYVVAELLLRAAADGCALHLALAAGRDDVAAAILGDLGELEAADAAADASAERALAASAGVTDAIGEARVEVGLGVAAPRERELPPPCAPLARLPRLAAARAAGGDARRRLLSARDGVGRTALEVALLARGDVRAAARLLRAGADADARTAGGGRSLLCALCALAGDGGARDGGGAAAAGGGGVAVAGVPGSLDAAAAVRLLLRAGADPNLAVADADPAAAAAAAAAGAAAAAAAAAASGGESRDELCGLRALDIALWCGADALVPQLVEAGAQLAAQAEPSTSGGVRAQLVSASAASAHLLIRAAQRSGAGQAQPAQPLARVLGWAVWARAQSGGTAAAATPAAAAPPPRPPPPAAAAAAVAAALSCLRVDAEDRRLGTTALLCAVDAGNEAALHALLAAGASPAAAASNGRLPLQAAVERSDFNSLHALLAAGAHADALCGGGAMGVPLLVLAAGAADATLALTLLECGADMDASAAGDGRGALGEAVRRGSADLVRALLERGARPAAGKDEAGNTLLHAAVLRAAPPTPKAAKAAKAAKRAAAAAGARPPPPTDAAALEASACEVVEGLLAYDLDVFEPDARGCTPLHLAARLGSARLCQLLLRAGADVHACDGAAEARTPAEVALEGRHLQALRVLLQGGRADVDRQTRRGSPLLHLAAAAGDAASVQLLMEMQYDATRRHATRGRSGGVRGRERGVPVRGWRACAQPRRAPLARACTVCPRVRASFLSSSRPPLCALPFAPCVCCARPRSATARTSTASTRTARARSTGRPRSATRTSCAACWRAARPSRSRTRSAWPLGARSHLRWSGRRAGRRTVEDAAKRPTLPSLTRTRSAGQGNRQPASHPASQTANQPATPSQLPRTRPRVSRAACGHARSPRPLARARAARASAARRCEASRRCTRRARRAARSRRRR
jgi:ankyrin repeat protein